MFERTAQADIRSALGWSPAVAILGARQVNSPKVYLRDSGLLHYLLGVRSVKDLMGHPSAGASWEGFCLEHIRAHQPKGATLSFYRTAAGAELDAVVEDGSRKIGFEIKFSSAPKVSKGFWQACEDVGVDQAYVLVPVREGWPMAERVNVIGLADVPGCLSA